jgi:hypothetical protein
VAGIQTLFNFEDRAQNSATAARYVFIDLFI